MLSVNCAIVGLYGYLQVDKMAAGRPSERLTTVFSEKGLVHGGDGRTKASAFCFTKARSHFEAVAMIHRYLESEGLAFKASVIEGVEDGSMRHNPPQRIYPRDLVMQVPYIAKMSLVIPA